MSEVEKLGLILKPVCCLSNKVIKYGSDLQMASRRKYYITSSKWMQLTRTVLQNLHESAITYHRAILCLAQNGWAHTSTPLLRTILELIVNCIVIVREDCEIRAFRYGVFELFKFNLDEEYPRKINKVIKTEWFVDLSEKNKESAKTYLDKLEKRKEKIYYWYSPDIYKGPRDVLKKEAPSLLEIYDIGGSASHGGQVGYRLFDRSPTLESVNPRKDPHSANLIALLSTRCLLEFCRLRDQFEKLGLDSYYNKYLKELLNFKKSSEIQR